MSEVQRFAGCFEMLGLLPQPGGFEGLGLTHIATRFEALAVPPSEETCPLLAGPSPLEM
jgi:hypothetical protein